MRDANRFQLNSDKYFPKWFQLLWFTAYFSIGTAVIVTLALAWDPGGLVLVVPVVAGAVLFKMVIAGTGDPTRNFVELGDHEFEVACYVPFFDVRRTFAYADVAKVTEVATHRFIWTTPWPPSARWSFAHVDVRLRKPMRVPFWSRPVVPWTRVIHLDTERTDELARELRARARLGEDAP